MAAVAGRFTGYGGQVLDGRFDGPQPHLRKFVVPGTGRTFNLRDGCMGFVIVHFILWWHEVIHAINVGIWDEWGWADRPTRGQTRITSEHAGGRAADVDATQHPRGVALARTFKAIQVARIRARLLFYRVRRGKALIRTLNWGGDFHSTVDGMHVEIADGATLAEVNKVAIRLMKTPRGKRILAANPGLREVILS